MPGACPTRSCAGWRPARRFRRRIPPMARDSSAASRLSTSAATWRARRRSPIRLMFQANRRKIALELGDIVGADQPADIAVGAHQHAFLRCEPIELAHEALIVDDVAAQADVMDA